MTTLSRLAKVIKGYTPPIGWIERAFASLVTAIHSVLPEYSISDVDKVLTIDRDEGHTVTKNIINEQSVTTTSRGRADLAANSWDFSELEDNEEVTVLINGVGATFTFLNNSLWGETDEQITNSGKLYDFDSSVTITISCSKTVTEYEPVLDWKAVRQTPAVGTNDKGKYLHTNDSTGDLEWGAVRQTPAVGADDKDKYLHTNASTGELEWGSVAGGSESPVITATYDEQTQKWVLPKTWTELYNGNYTTVKFPDRDLQMFIPILSVEVSMESTYDVVLQVVSSLAPNSTVTFDGMTFTAANENGYPTGTI